MALCALVRHSLTDRTVAAVPIVVNAIHERDSHQNFSTRLFETSSRYCADPR
jgi:hypothetical protein